MTSLPKRFFRITGHSSTSSIALPEKMHPHSDGAKQFNHFKISSNCKVTEQSAMPSNPAKDANFKEDRIDKLRAQKDDELDRYRRTNERNANRRWNSATPSEFDQSFGSNK